MMRVTRSCVQFAYWNYAMALLKTVDDYVPLLTANELLQKRKLQLEAEFSQSLQLLKIQYDSPAKVYRIYQDTKPIFTMP